MDTACLYWERRTPVLYIAQRRNVVMQGRYGTVIVSSVRPGYEFQSVRQYSNQSWKSAASLNKFLLVPWPATTTDIITLTHVLLWY